MEQKKTTSPWPWFVSGAFFCILYIGLGLWMARNSHDSNFDFAVFQSYRMVFNNLNFPEVTGLSAMTHPANAKDLHLYSTLLSPLFTWWMTLWSAVVGLDPHLIKMGGVLIYFPTIIWGSQSLSKTCGGQPWVSAGVFLLGPLFLIHSIACDWMVFSLTFSLLPMAELCRDKPRSWLIALYAFVSVCVQFYNCVHLALAFFVLLSLQGFNFKRGALSWKTSWMSATACIAGLALAIFIRSFADERIPSFFDYFVTRSNQAIVQPQGISFYLFTLERVWGHMTYNFPLFLLLVISIGAVLSAPPSSKKKVLVSALIGHFLYCSLLTGTTAAHYFYSFYYLMLTPAFVALAGFRFHVKTQPWTIAGLCLLLALSAYELRKTGMWSPQSNDVDRFLAEMDPGDVLIRDEFYNTWPFNYQNPLNTVYLDPDEKGAEPFEDIEQGTVHGYELSWNTAYHVRPKYQRWKPFEAAPDRGIYYLTRKKSKRFPLIMSHQRHIVHEGLITYYLYECSPAKAPSPKT